MTANSPFLRDELARAVERIDEPRRVGRARSPRTMAGSLSSATIGTPGKRAREALARGARWPRWSARVTGSSFALNSTSKGAGVDAHHERALASRAAASATSRRVARQVAHGSIPTLSSARGMRIRSSSRR